MKIPWRGMSPWLLTIRGLVQLALSGLVIWGSLQVIGGHFDLTDTGLAEQEANIDRVATVVLVVAAAFAVYCIARLTVGILDIAGPRRAVEGVVAGVRYRKSLDFLPPIAQHLYFRRGDDYHDRETRRQRWYELVLDTAQGPQTFIVRPGIANSQQPGARVVVKASRILGHVSRVEPVAAAHQPH